MNENPFTPIYQKLQEITSKIDEIVNPEVDYSLVFYSAQEAAKILKYSEQTIKKKIKAGEIFAKPRTLPYRIPHYEIFDFENKPKDLKYKRKA